MKANWTRIERRLRKFLGDRYSVRAVEAHFNRSFLLHHQHAEEIIVLKNGDALAAIYFTPLGRHQEHVKRVFSEVRERVLWECDK